jgi:hypothetical protein
MAHMAWDLWIDFQSGDDEGLTRANTRNLRAGLTVTVGDVLVVGNEDAEPGVGEVIELGDRGFVLVKVFPGTVEENRFRLRPGYASAS